MAELETEYRRSLLLFGISAVYVFYVSCIWDLNDGFLIPGIVMILGVGFQIAIILSELVGDAKLRGSVSKYRDWPAPALQDSIERFFGGLLSEISQLPNHAARKFIGAASYLLLIPVSMFLAVLWANTGDIVQVSDFGVIFQGAGSLILAAGEYSQTVSSYKSLWGEENPKSEEENKFLKQMAAKTVGFLLLGIGVMLSLVVFSSGDPEVAVAGEIAIPAIVGILLTILFLIEGVGGILKVALASSYALAIIVVIVTVSIVSPILAWACGIVMLGAGASMVFI